MPKRATTRSTTQRAAPYQLRSVSSVSQASNMAVAVSPIGSMWNPLHQHGHQHGHQQHTPFPLDWQQPPQYDQYSHEMMLAQSAPMRPQVSGAPAVQQVQSQSVPMRSSHSHSNSGGGGPWTAEMDEILIENHRRLKWDQIAERFFGNTKTGNACRKRHARVISERKEPSRWEHERVQKVVDAYNEVGLREKMWAHLAKATNERWQDVERLCYGQGYRVLTHRTGYGHSRRRSRAVSHRSQASINSDGGVRPYDDDDGPTDDSGIGADYQPGQHHLSVTHPEYHTPADTYQADVSGYAEDYYRYPSGRN